MCVCVCVPPIFSERLAAVAELEWEPEDEALLFLRRWCDATARAWCTASCSATAWRRSVARQTDGLLFATTAPRELSFDE